MQTDLHKRRKDLRRQVQKDYDQLRQAMENLSEAVQDRADVGRVVHRQPYVWLTCAMSIGLAMGLLGSGSSSR